MDHHGAHDVHCACLSSMARPEQLTAVGLFMTYSCGLAALSHR